MSAPVQEGEILAGKYRVDKVLGVGGMGVVVAAHHVDLDERVAIKFLLPETLGNPEAVARFAREARAAVRIKNEHVARVTDVGKLENGAPYMVMEYLDGVDLSGWMKREGTMSVEQATEFLLQACEAIAEAHVLGIIHRDLKPANLFVIRRPDGTLSVKVLDFGISKTTGPSSSQADASMTRTSSLMGSPLYMSPEQMQSSKDVDSRTDIWALGVILYELVTGAPPFEGETIPELVLKIMSSAPQPLRNRKPDAPDGFEAVILKALAKNRDERWESVGALATALLPFAPRRSRASVERISGILRAAGYSTANITAPLSDHDGLESHDAQTNASFSRTRREGGSGGKFAIGGAVALAAVVAVVVALRHGSSDASAVPSAQPVDVASSAVVVPAAGPEGTPSAAAGDSVPSASSQVPAVRPVIAEKPPEKACTPGASRCAGPDVQKCGEDGSWGALKACANKSQECREGGCMTLRRTTSAAVAAMPVATAAATAAAQAPPKPAAQTPPKPNCSPNYFFDAEGNKHFKPECF